MELQGRTVRAANISQFVQQQWGEKIAGAPTIYNLKTETSHKDGIGFNVLTIVEQHSTNPEPEIMVGHQTFSDHF